MSHNFWVLATALFGFDLMFVTMHLWGDYTHVKVQKHNFLQIHIHRLPGAEVSIFSDDVLTTLELKT